MGGGDVLGASGDTKIAHDAGLEQVGRSQCPAFVSEADGFFHLDRFGAGGVTAATMTAMLRLGENVINGLDRGPGIAE